MKRQFYWHICVVCVFPLHDFQYQAAANNSLNCFLGSAKTKFCPVLLACSVHLQGILHLIFIVVITFLYQYWIIFQCPTETGEDLLLPSLFDIYLGGCNWYKAGWLLFLAAVLHPLPHNLFCVISNSDIEVYHVTWAKISSLWELVIFSGFEL